MAEGRFAPPPRLVLCAGQGCNVRENCLRFKVRATVANWSSFDLERINFPQLDCPHKRPVNDQEVANVQVHRRR